MGQSSGGMPWSHNQPCLLHLAQAPTDHLQGQGDVETGAAVPDSDNEIFASKHMGTCMAAGGPLPADTCIR